MLTDGLPQRALPARSWPLLSIHVASTPACMTLTETLLATMTLTETPVCV